jgi:hypothetical protein
VAEWLTCRDKIGNESESLGLSGFAGETRRLKNEVPKAQGQSGGNRHQIAVTEYNPPDDQYVGGLNVLN